METKKVCSAEEAAEAEVREAKATIKDARAAIAEAQAVARQASEATDGAQAAVDEADDVIADARATLAPPLLTASWLRDNHRCLNHLQIEGELCVYCGREQRPMVPVGHLGARQLFACQPACTAALGVERP